MQERALQYNIGDFVHINGWSSTKMFLVLARMNNPRFTSFEHQYIITDDIKTFLCASSQPENIISGIVPFEEQYLNQFKKYQFTAEDIEQKYISLCEQTKRYFEERKRCSGLEFHYEIMSKDVFFKILGYT